MKQQIVDGEFEHFRKFPQNINHFPETVLFPVNLSATTPDSHSFAGAANLAEAHKTPFRFFFSADCWKTLEDIRVVVCFAQFSLT